MRAREVCIISDDDDDTTQQPVGTKDIFMFSVPPVDVRETEGEFANMNALSPQLRPLIDPNYLGIFFNRIRTVDYILKPVKMAFISQPFYASTRADRNVMKEINSGARAIAFCVFDSAKAYSWPRKFTLIVNSREYSRPERLHQKDSAKFWIDVTESLKFGANGFHIISEQNRANDFFYVAVALFSPIDDFALREIVGSRGFFSLDDWRSLFAELYQDDEGEISVSKVIMTLLCPLGMWRMQTPVRGINCAHLACFDMLTYVRYQREIGDWKCPVCCKDCRFEDLRIDETLLRILTSVPETVEDLEVDSTGDIVRRD